ncbi:hypothetical protein BH18ACT1_BH18ACT1_18310 [soil metagenome]
MEPGETVADAVVRELAEETGVVGTCGPLLGWVERIDAERHFVILDLRVEVDAHDRLAVAGGDAEDAAWVPLAEVPTLALVDGLADFLIEHSVLETRVSDPSTRGRASR